MNRRLIADAGGTKTNWAMIEDGQIRTCATAGFNASVDSEHDLRILLDTLTAEIKGLDFEYLFFYCAGLIAVDQKNRVLHTLESFFQVVQVEVLPDTLGACRAIYQRESGWLGLLGTGSGLVFYDGKDIQIPVPSLGYLLGDEGGGTYIGKRLIKDYFRKKIPGEIAKKIDQLHGDKMQVEDVYEAKKTAAFLSAFTKAIADHTEEGYVQQLLSDAFHLYFRTYVPGHVRQIAFVGSIAASFFSSLEKVGETMGIQCTVEQSPLEGLISYHSRNS